MACILALDGFYVDGRNIRASYGTSKYCSAFIKNVRCNNPDCTYLHMMGDSEDTFTKQEIQAGYVTSGRDVLARQQQLAAATAGSSSRRRVGHGGPSGTGKVATNPVFPPPTFEEQPKPSQTSLVPPPPPATSSTTQFPPVSSAAMQRSSTSNGIAGFSSVAAGNGSASMPSITKMTRSTSLPSSSTKPEPALTPAEMLSRQQEELRKRHPQNSTNANKKNSASADPPTSSHSNGTERSTSVSAPSASPSTTAASIVAGVHSTSKPGVSQPAPHTTLTPLTPLKRAPLLSEKKELSIPSKSSDSVLLSQNMQGSKGLSSSQQAAFFDVNSGSHQRESSKLSALRSSSTTLQNDANVPLSSNLKAPASTTNTIGVGSIGGKVIGGSSASIGSLGAPIGSFGNSSNSLNNVAMMNNSSHSLLGSIGPSSLGIDGISANGNPVGGLDVGGSSAIGGSSILSQPLLSGGADNSQFGLREPKTVKNISNGLFGGGNDFGSIGGTGLWDQPKQNNIQRHSAGPTNNSIGGSLIDDQSNVLPKSSGQSNIPRDNVSGSSALASMLGIELPTGVGSLRETLWASSTPLKDPFSEVKNNAPTPIGAGIKKSNVIGGQPNRNIPIGGFDIGGQSSHMSSGGVPIGGYGSSTGSTIGGNKSDVALLQSLLPGVHITSGNAYQPAANQNSNIFAGSGNWNGFGTNTNQNEQQSQMMVGGLMPNQHRQDEGAWKNEGYAAAPGSQKEVNARKQNHSNTIW